MSAFPTLLRTKRTLPICEYERLTGIASLVRKKRRIFRRRVFDEPITEAEGVAICRPFVGQDRRSADARAGNRASELIERFRIRAMAPMITCEQDPYLFAAFDAFVKRASEGIESGKKCERINGDHRHASRRFRHEPPCDSERDRHGPDNPNNNRQLHQWSTTCFPHPKSDTANQ